MQNIAELCEKICTFVKNTMFRITAALFVCGTLVTYSLAQADGTFIATGSMNAARNRPSATLLNDGRVLVLGQDLSTGEIYDPMTGAFSLTKPSINPIAISAATLLGDGTVLILDDKGLAELFDPASLSFRMTGAPVRSLFGATSTKLSSGKVLFVGGYTSGLIPANPEIYDPQVGSFAETHSNTAFAHGTGFTTTLLGDGRVLIAGGCCAGAAAGVGGISDVELYDPVSDSFMPTEAMLNPRSNHSATLLLNGKVLLAGGTGIGLNLNSELYDPATDTFSQSGALRIFRQTHTATLLANGNVLIAGGGQGAEVYHARTGDFSDIIPMNTNRITHAASILQNGNVLVVGGFDFSNNATPTAELFAAVNETPIVLVVPGIFGTKLASSNEVEWLSNEVINQALFAALQQNLGSPSLAISTFDDLAYDVNGNQTVTLTTSARTSAGDFGGLLNLSEEPANSSYALNCDTLVAKVLGQSECSKTIYTYNSLINALTEAGFSTETFPYDWRRDIGELSEDLFVTIKTIRDTHPNTPVAIVAHSMGALIVGEMLRRHQAIAPNLGPVITLGGPFAGSLDAYLKLQGWEATIPVVLNQATTARIGSNWTSPYELLPRWDFVLLNGGLADYKSLYSGTGPFDPLPRQSALPLAYSFWNASINMPQLNNAFAIIGTGIPTPVELDDVERAGCFHVNESGGDGTVPLRSARNASWIPFANFRYVVESHSALPQNQEVQSAILSILRGGKPSNLSTTDPSTSVFLNAYGCSPIDLSISDSTAHTTSANSQQIDSTQYLRIADVPEILAPAEQNYSLNVIGTNAGVFNLFIDQSDSEGTIIRKTTFHDVPVLQGSKGVLQVIGSTAVGSLSYDYLGNGNNDLIPPNFVPPKLECVSCNLGRGIHSAVVDFHVGYMGRTSRFCLSRFIMDEDDRPSTFLSTRVVAIHVLSTEVATFSGEGALNGVPGFTFSVTIAKNSRTETIGGQKIEADGAEQSKGKDEISIEINGPDGCRFRRHMKKLIGKLVIVPGDANQ